MRTLAMAMILSVVPWAASTARAVEADRLAQGNNEFAIALFQRLAAAERGNIFCSPYSISSALAMTYAGARGQTAREMAQVLRFTGPDEQVHRGFGELTDSLNAEGKAGKVQLVVANALWGQKGFRFEKDFLALTGRYYGGRLDLLDFRGDTEAARRTINAWVEEQTRDKIKELIKSGILTPLTRLVLTNAIYFKGDWAAQFKKTATKDEPFHAGGGKQPRVPLMQQTGKFGYMETPDFQALELPYIGDRLSMTVLLPREKDGLADLEKRLTAKDLAEWLGRMKRRTVKVQLPRVKTSSGFELRSVLKTLGMKDAFAAPSSRPEPAGADFSGMDGARDLYISAVIHKAFVEVNEEGTEAAAATAVVLSRSPSVEGPPPVFRADHPFLFLIRDRRSGAILFLGRLALPEG